MSRYLEILATQRPFWFNTDENNRQMFSVNFTGLAAAPVEQWEEELAARLIAQGAGTALGTDIFVGGGAVIPTGTGPYTTIIDTGGIGGRDETHNSDFYERLSVQIVVRATNYLTARTRALAIWRALDGVRNTTLAA